MKKTISKKIAPSSSLEVEPETTEQTEQPSRRKKCFFCEGKSLPTYTDAVTLRRFLTDRSRIVSKLRSGLCSKHQRQVSRQIKYARHLALLPFTPKI